MSNVEAFTLQILIGGLILCAAILWLTIKLLVKTARQAIPVIAKGIAKSTPAVYAGVSKGVVTAASAARRSGVHHTVANAANVASLRCVASLQALACQRKQQPEEVAAPVDLGSCWDQYEAPAYQRKGVVLSF